MRLKTKRTQYFLNMVTAGALSFGVNAGVATFLKKGITDVNAVVQEKALDALIVLVDRDALK